MLGAAATGSNSVECGELLIPEHRVSRWIGDVFKLLQVGDMGYAFIAALPLGMARYALEAFHDLANGRGIRMLGYEKMYDSAVVQTAIATAHTNIKMIEAYQHWVLSTLQPGAERITRPAADRSRRILCYWPGAGLRSSGSSTTYADRRDRPGRSTSSSSCAT